MKGSPEKMLDAIEPLFKNHENATEALLDMKKLF
jgi:hypothetical protein